MRPARDNRTVIRIEEHLRPDRGDGASGAARSCFVVGMYTVRATRTATGYYHCEHKILRTASGQLRFTLIALARDLTGSLYLLPSPGVFLRCVRVEPGALVRQRLDGRGAR